MVARRESEYMTVEEWRELERNSHDIKHEYIDGRVYALAGGTLSDSRLSTICLGLLKMHSPPQERHAMFIIPILLHAFLPSVIPILI